MLESNDILNSDIFDFPVYPLSENLTERGRGDNVRQILICLAGAGTPELHVFLEKIMASVKVDLTTDTFSIPIADQEQFRFASLAQEKGFTTAIFFGLVPAQAGLHLNVQKYQPLTFGEQTFLFADKLETIQTQSQFKRPLWEALKKIFGD
ncbi:MAG: hypothetical protein AAFZ15_00805 [Bacteroidota bacterium]